MAQSRLACALAGAAVSVLALTGCAGGDPGAAQTPPDSPSASASAPASVPPSATPTPTPSPASADGPAVNIPVPEKPALADENTVEGLEAFTEWWFELGNYAVITGNSAPWIAETDPGCKNCSALVDSVNRSHADGGWVVGGSVTVETFDSKFRETTQGSVASFVTMSQDASAYYSSEGNLIEELPAREEQVVRQTFAEHNGERWIMLDFGSPNTGS
nr:DUF6318 family protein [uncultured Arthrobacter sp.]